MHDTVDLEARGVRSTFVATLEFVDAAEGQARALGAESTAIYVRHPIQDRSNDEMEEVAEGAFDALERALLSD